MPKRILIVEDELDLRSTLEFKFKSEGYTVNAVSKGKDALEAIARKNPDQRLRAFAGFLFCNSFS
jgi:DNA-binding response OmpR family regulator